MNRDRVDKIARALLYEGYILYPYRPSTKNRQRWTFGGIYPKSYSDAQNGTDPWFMQSQFLVRGAPEFNVQITLRFLHLMLRTVNEIVQQFGPLSPSPGTPGEGRGEGSLRLVASMEIDGKHFETWQEATEREIDLGTFPLSDLLIAPQNKAFNFAASGQYEMVKDSAGCEVAQLLRQQWPIQVGVVISAEHITGAVYQLTARIENQTTFDCTNQTTRDDALLRCFASTHVFFEADAAEFISMTDPPPSLAQEAASCSNIGCWPILVGLAGDASAMLASPIILSDYPEIAPESPGDLFDGGEIDEILTLRILTLTDDEKQRMACVDERTRALLARTEALGREQLYALHATMRPMEPNHA